MKEAKDLLRKGFLLGLGAASLTSKKVNETIKGLKKKGKLNSAEGEELVKKFIKEADSERKRVEKFILGEVKRYTKPVKKKTAKKKPVKKKVTKKKR
jgi:polyhydroxyalkanoate synthesis regulator phasin